jgi:hypothetical protein
MWCALMGNMDAFDQILSLITVLYPPEVVIPYIINDIAEKRKYSFEHLHYFKHVRNSRKELLQLLEYLDNGKTRAFI